MLKRRLRKLNTYSRPLSLFFRLQLVWCFRVGKASAIERAYDGGYNTNDSLLVLCRRQQLSFVA